MLSSKVWSIQNGGGYKHTYGYSGKGRELNYYKIGSGSKALIYTCAVHGWEDNWEGDGIELVRIGNQLVDHFTKNGTGDFTLYIIPAVNPDGVAEGFTNNGQGRCTIIGAIDCNRDFPIAYIPYGPSRHWTNTKALSVSETRALAELIQGTIIKSHSDCYLIDMHGWEQSAIGNPDIAKHFISKFSLEPKLNRYGDNGYLIEWAHNIGIKSMLLELPTDTHSHEQVVSRNYAGKIIEGVSELINAVRTGWINKDGKWYYFNSDGTMRTNAWLTQSNGQTFYLGADGIKYIGKHTIGGVEYTFNSAGILQGSINEGGSGTIIGPVTQNDLFNVLHGLYNAGGGLTSIRNCEVLNYLRYLRYGNSDDTSSLVWNFLIPPNKSYNSIVNSNKNLAAQASMFTDSHTIDIYGSEIGIPHLAITTLCYNDGFLKNLVIPSFWTGWGGGFSNSTRTSDLLFK